MSESVSRVLSRMIIYLGYALLRSSCGSPGRSAGSFSPPLFGLAPGRVYQASASRRSWWSLTPPFQLSTACAEGFLFCGTFLIPVTEQLPLATTLPCGARTFLPDFSERSPDSLIHMVSLKHSHCKQATYCARKPCYNKQISIDTGFVSGLYLQRACTNIAAIAAEFILQQRGSNEPGAA